MLKESRQPTLLDVATAYTQERGRGEGEERDG
jgi:hypothetical protein